MNTITPEHKARAVMGTLIAAHLDGRDMRQMKLTAWEMEALAAFEVPAEDVREMLLKQQRRRASRANKTISPVSYRPGPVKKLSKTAKRKRNRRLAAGSFIGTGDWRARPMADPDAGRGKGSSKHTTYCA